MLCHLAARGRNKGLGLQNTSKDSVPGMLGCPLGTGEVEINLFSILRIVAPMPWLMHSGKVASPKRYGLHQDSSRMLGDRLFSLI